MGVTSVQFLSKLMPREPRFFQLFEQHAAQVVAASAVLSELLRGFTREEDKRPERIARILELEHNADKVTPSHSCTGHSSRRWTARTSIA